MHRILFISHGHPELSKGGAEVASWNLFSAMKEKGHECMYLARTEGTSHGGSTFSVREPDQVLFHTGMTDWFCLSSNKTKQLFDDLGDFVQAFAPTIIHVHHYAHIGIEIFKSLQQAAPDAKIVFTLHEFMAICLHNGQMVKNNSMKLCYKESASDCNKCFPQHSPADFYLRKRYIQNLFSIVDHFISPSQFLADRYIEWGINSNQVSVIENVLPKSRKLSPRQVRPDEKRTKLAFFGQLNPYKGIDVLLQAIDELPKSLKKNISLNIHGANLDKQDTNFQNSIEKSLKKLGGIVHMRGSYESEQLPSLMANCDWVIIPSVWWENSPVVIQEAIAHGRPLIGSNIGGMREKIEGIAGLTFDVQSPTALSASIVEAVKPEVFDHWHEKLEGSTNELTQKHEQLLNQLTNSI